MRFVRFRGVRLHVGREADLETDTPVVHVLSQLGIFDETRRVSEAICSAFVNCVADGPCSVAFTGVNGHGQVVFSGVGERIRVRRCRKPCFTACEIEGDNALLLVGNRKLRKLE